MTLPTTALAVLAIAGSAFCLAWGAASDIRNYEIPNTASAIVLGAYVLFALSTPAASRLGAFAVCACVLAAGLTLFLRGSMGGGDVKLLTAVAPWCGPHLLAEFAIVMGLAGAALAGLMLSPLRRLMPPAPQAAVVAAGGGAALRQPMPFGVAIAAGGAWVLFRQSALLIR
jgi:prepilin peptidase CpaA